MLPITIVAAMLMTRSAYAGYIYPRPNIAFELTKQEPSFEAGFTQKTSQENVAHQPYASDFYSVPYQDYNYIHQTQDPNNAPLVSISSVNNLSQTSISSSPAGNLPSSYIFEDNVPTFNVPSAPVTFISQQNDREVNSLPQVNISPVITPSLQLPVPIKQQNSFPVNTVQHINIPNVNVPSVNILSGNFPNAYEHLSNLQTINIPTAPIVSTHSQSNFELNRDSLPTVNSPALLSQQNNFNDNTVHYEISAVNTLSSVNSPASINQQSNLELSTQHQFINQGVNNNLNSLTNIQQNFVSPIITKDIYFHVPPPEIEESSVRVATPNKKIYKIIFIKVPSQDRRNVAQFQGNIYNQGVPIEDRTIIYVLSKGAEYPQQEFLPKSVPSEHEVLFVKYSGNAEDTVAQISDNLDHSEQPASQLVATQILQPGLINGER